MPTQKYGMMVCVTRTDVCLWLKMYVFRRPFYYKRVVFLVLTGRFFVLLRSGKLLFLIDASYMVLNGLFQYDGQEKDNIIRSPRKKYIYFT